MTNVLTGMVGHGFYNQNSATQLATINYVRSWLEEASSSLDLTDSLAAVRLVDFGCSEGRNSIAVMEPLIATLRQRTDRPIETIHSDLPTNDYSALFTLLRPEGHSVFGHPQIYSAVVGGSMFDQLLPPRSTHVATTFNSIGWLTRRSLERLPDYIQPNGPSTRRNIGGISEDDRRVFAEQANADLERFLQARAAEIVPGGKLLVQVFGAGEMQRTCDGIYDSLNDAILEVLESGLIDRESYESYYQPVYFRTLEELTAPVTGPDASLAHLFQLERAETYEVPVPFVEDFQKSGETKVFARDYTNFYRAFTEPVLRENFADHADVDRLVSEVYGRAERLIGDHPDRYEFHFVSVAALLTRKPDD